MALNIVFVLFFLIAFAVALVKLLVFGDVHVFQDIVNSTFDSSKTAAEIALGLIGVMTFWLGVMKVGEKGGVIRVFARLIGPLFRKLFPDIPKDHPVYGSILMNFSANMLGLDNAATPLGLKAMKELQDLNPNPHQASNAQIMFTVLNSCSLVLLPTTIMAYRAQEGARNPSDVFLPILIATYVSILAGLLMVSLYQRIRLWDKTLMAYLGGISLLVASLLWYFHGLSPARINVISTVAGNCILFGIVASFILLAFIRKVNVYDAFIEGAKEGFAISIKIIPYLVAILVAVGVFRASGCMDVLMQGFSHLFHWMGLNTDFVPALPVAMMKPLSGSGARGLMVEVMHKLGADSFPGRVACVIQGSTETTFYVLAVYFGSVSIKKTRYALPCALVAELTGAVAAILVSYVFFH